MSETNNNNNKNNKDAWYGTEIQNVWDGQLDTKTQATINWCAPQTSSVSYEKWVATNKVADDEPSDDEFTENGSLCELCKLYQAVGPRRFYALVDWWGLELDEKARETLSNGCSGVGE